MRQTSGVVVQLVFLSALLASCASSPTPSVWKEETYLDGPVKKVFVIGAFTETGIRKLVEMEFVARFAADGTEAIASHTVLSTVTVQKYDAVLSVVKEQGCDAVILVRSAGRIGGKPLFPPDGASRRAVSDLWTEYYLKGYPAMPAYSWQKEHYGVETDLFETATGRPLWKASFDITAEGPAVRQVVPLVSVMVEHLHADRMIR